MNSRVTTKMTVRTMGRFRQEQEYLILDGSPSTVSSKVSN